ncbi:hypothetical protein BC831DRAFT_512209 [Entophlyctis helioformis]|nr:hypothetical protein BC831DRAFT_512209 [Entophlyctis helioformis]
MPFVKNVFTGREQFIKPSVITPAITSLSDTLCRLFRGLKASMKPVVVTCFDTSGSGKTTTAMEAARLQSACVVTLSPNTSLLLSQVLSSCERYPFEAVGGIVNGNTVQRVFRAKFDSMLTTMFHDIEALLTSNASNCIDEAATGIDYVSPNASQQDVRLPKQTPQSAFNGMLEALGDRKLVIHVDDCQLFFKGAIPSPNGIRAVLAKDDVMVLALRSFTNCITPYANRKNLAWVFSGCRPTLVTEITQTAGLLTIDITDMMADFQHDEIREILGNYFSLEAATTQEAERLSKLYERLAGPPKIVQFFLMASSECRLACVQDLIDQWDIIESEAAVIFKDRIVSTFGGSLDATARSLALLHATAIATTRKDYVLVPEVSRHFIKLIEAGLLRVRRATGGQWTIYAPNHLLLRIFRQYVHWYTWDNIAMLQHLVKSSETVQTLKGKVFEFLFALELCDSADGKLWTFLRNRVKLVPKCSWSPTISFMESIAECNDTSRIYVMQDPDRSGSKCDVVFFATSQELGTTVRVLVQLTIAARGKAKIDESLQGMLAQSAMIIDGEQLLDYRLFIAPNYPADSNQGSRNLADRGYVFTSSALSDAFEFPVNITCNPEATDTAIKHLARMAEAMGELGLVNRIAGDSEQRSVSSKRQRVAPQPLAGTFDFDDMDGFYSALKTRTNVNDDDIRMIAEIFGSQRIDFSILPSLTDNDLKELGIAAMGLRKSILAVLGK